MFVCMCLSVYVMCTCMHMDDGYVWVYVYIFVHACVYMYTCLPQPPVHHYLLYGISITIKTNYTFTVILSTLYSNAV